MIKPISVCCSNCDLELIQVIAKPVDDNLKWTMIVHCPKCGDKSYKKTFEGLLSMANGERTEISHSEDISNVIHIHTVLRN